MVVAHITVREQHARRSQSIHVGCMYIIRAHEAEIRIALIIAHQHDDIWKRLPRGLFGCCFIGTAA